jgi:hypothetical protein
MGQRPTESMPAWLPVTVGSESLHLCLVCALGKELPHRVRARTMTANIAIPKATAGNSQELAVMVDELLDESLRCSGRPESDAAHARA